MITHFIEASNNFNHGKFMVARLSEEERAKRSALPGFETESLWTCAGLRKLNASTTLVLDLQTGEGASFLLEGSAIADLEKHKIWVCPMFEPFLLWLYAQDLGQGKGDITSLPRYVELEAESAMAGYRRKGEGN